MNSKQTESRWILWLEWAAFIALVALATYLRYWRITEVPPGFNSDEAVGAMGALTTLREGFKYSYEGQGGSGSLGFYLATIAFFLFGPSIAAIRGLAAWVGVVSIWANYWAIREIFRVHGLTRARWLAGLSTLGLTVSIWHLSASRIAFAGIGVPFLMLPSVYFLWFGLNRTGNRGWRAWWPFIVSGIFLGGLMYIYLSGVFAPPFYAAFFITQWLIVKFWQRLDRPSPITRHPSLLSKLKVTEPAVAYLTTQFGNLLVTALTATLLLLPVVYILFTRPNLEPGTTRVSQAFFLNPQINQGDPWGLLWRSFVGNFGAYGLSLLWFIGQPPRLAIPLFVGLSVFGGFWVALWRGLRGQAAYQFILLWLGMLLLPSILSPDIIPHQLRTIGATTPVYVLAAIFIVWLFELLGWVGRRWLSPRLEQTTFKWLMGAVTLTLALSLTWNFWQATANTLYAYFYIFPKTNDAKAAYHVYAVKMAEEIISDARSEVAFILPRNTAAGDVYQNFTTDFLTELAHPPAAHYWVIDDETTLAADLTQAAAKHSLMRVVKWKTSKHTGADPKQVIPYYLEKYGHYDHTDTYEYFDIDTYILDQSAPNFNAGEKVQPQAVDFGGQLRLTGFAFGDAGDVAYVTAPQAHSNDLLWLRLNWQKIADHSENLKASVLVYTTAGQLVTQIDKLLQNNILQVASLKWPLDARESTYFLIPLPPATPPGEYVLKLAVYGEESLTRLPVNGSGERGGVYSLTDFTILPAQKPVTPADLKLALPINQELLPGLTLLGFETLPGEAVRSGDHIGMSVIWQAGTPSPAADLRMALTVKPQEGDQEIPLSEPTDLAGSYPSNRWQPGELLRGWLTARIPPTLEPGVYKLRLRLTNAVSPGQTAKVFPIGEFKVEGWSRQFNPPQPRFEIGADFNGQATLIGLDTAAQQVSPGDTLDIQLYWRADSEFDRNYTAFVHLIGPDGQLYGQVDQTPGAGAFPTTGWLPGEYLTDVYAVPIASHAPAGDYQIEVGLYDSNSGQRLPVRKPNCQSTSCNQDDKVLAPGLTVK